MGRAVISFFIINVLISSTFCRAQSGFEELRGRYSLIYDSTFIWPDGKGGYEYKRRFVSEAILAEKGRDVLSRPATPVLARDDEIDIRAYTILPSGEKYDVEQDEVVTREFPDGSRRIFINFRQREPGALLHLEWDLISRRGTTAGIRYIGRTIGVDSSIVIITAPETWVFNFMVSPECRTVEGKTVDNSIAGPAPTNYSWVCTNLEDLQIEEFSPPVNRIIPALYFSLSFDVGWPDPETQAVSWSNIARAYHRQMNDFISKGSSINDIADSLAALTGDDAEAARLAFDWVKTNFRSVSSEISLSPHLNETLEKGRGTQAEASAIFYAILRRMNIPCSPYLAASREIGNPLDAIPALFWFDRLLIACRPGPEIMWADPLYPVSQLGILPYEDQSVSVLRLDEQSVAFESTPDIDYHDNGKAIHLRLDIDSAGALYGEATEIYTGAMIPEISSYIISLDEGQRRLPWERKLAKSFPGVKLDKFVAIPPDSGEESYRIGYTFTTGPIIRPFATRAYIPMDLLGRWEDLPDLPAGKRKFPIEIRRPRFEFERITLNISPAFDVEYTPKNYSLNSLIGEIYSVARRSDKVVTITRGFGFKRSGLPISSYKSLRRFINTARAEADKQIILIRRD
jgi:hypothetical protein